MAEVMESVSGFLCPTTYADMFIFLLR